MQTTPEQKVILLIHALMVPAADPVILKKSFPLCKNS